LKPEPANFAIAADAERAMRRRPGPEADPLFSAPALAGPASCRFTPDSPAR
jgi:hypothetical protein